MGKIILGIIVFNSIIFTSFLFTENYQWIIIVLHFLSFVPILFLTTKKTLKFIKIKPHEWLVILGVVIVAFVIRLAGIETITPGMQGDEIIVAHSVKELRENFTPFVTSNFGHGSIIPYLVSLSIRFFGDSIFAIRLPSVVFGVLGVGAFYLLVRLFFKPQLATVGAVLFAFSYPMIALSRVIYEPTASIFFQLLSLFFVILGIKTRRIVYFAATGLMLGLGNYTYVNFRLYTIAILLLVVVWSLVEKTSLKIKMHYVFITLTFTLIGMLPLLHYFFVNPDQFFARAQVLSLFNQGLPISEITNNLMGNFSQLRYVFLFPGDPNFRMNPGKSSMVDIVTLTFFFAGFLYLIRRKLKLLFFFLALSTPFILSDILAYEAGPANTFYGFAHPNTLRISGIIPFIILVAVFGIYGVAKFIERNLVDNEVNKGAIKLYKTYAAVVVLVICAFLNYTLYFFQPYDPYTNSVNGVTQLKVVKQVNAMDSTKKIYATKPIKEDIRFQYFLQPGKNVELFDPTTANDARRIIANADMVFIDSTFNLEILKELVDNNTTGKRLLIHQVPDGVDAFMFLGDAQLAIDDFFPI